MGAVVAALKSTGMWANSLVLFSADNGGPSLVGGASFANNYPLRGSKGNAFEGGTRVLAAVSGGLVPSSRFNKKLPAPGNGHVHVADVYATFCGLAQHPDCVDRPGGRIPPSESFDLWPFISGQTDVSPRNESVLEFRNSSAGPWTGDTSFDAALVQGDFKYVQGRQGGTGYWWGPEYPNSTAKVPMDAPGCPLGCLYNITEDETGLLCYVSSSHVNHMDKSGSILLCLAHASIHTFYINTCLHFITQTRTHAITNPRFNHHIPFTTCV